MQHAVLLVQERRQHRHVAQRHDFAGHSHLPGDGGNLHGVLQVGFAQEAHDLALDFDVL